MAKELPYFKFYISEWLNGDITLEDYECQGLFINICAYYWSKNSYLPLSVLHKRFRGQEHNIETLIQSGIIKVNDDLIDISFLNEQMDSKEIQKITNQKNGAKGGRPKKEKSEKKPNGLFSETETITESEPNVNPKQTNIEESKEDKRKLKEIKEDNTFDFIEDLAFKELFKRWVKYKSERKEKYKSSDSLKTAFNNLKKWAGGDILIATKIIENSIGMNYAGFFEPKNNTIQNGTKNTNTLKSDNGTYNAKDFGKL